MSDRSNLKGRLFVYETFFRPGEEAPTKHGVYLNPNWDYLDPKEDPPSDTDILAFGLNRFDPFSWREPRLALDKVQGWMEFSDAICSHR